MHPDMTDRLACCQAQRFCWLFSFADIRKQSMIFMPKSLPLIYLLALLCFTCKQKHPVFSTSEGAIEGYDPVAYFTESKPVKGSKNYAFQWMDATWYFASEKNRELFEADPTRYAPQFGGYCAYGVAMGDLVKIAPDAWKIVDGKLYLNYDKEYQKKWETDQGAFITQATVNWSKLKASN